MQFVFNGTLEELKEAILSKAKEQGKEILIYHDAPSTLEIGFQRLGHSGGRFFIATIEETETGVVLRGDISDVSSGKPESKTSAFLTTLGAFAMFYILTALALSAIWLLFFQFSHIWIPLLFPIPVLVFLKRKAIQEEKKTDGDFVAFMSGFTARFCPYLEQYIDEGCCYDLQMILGGYIKESALPEVTVDKAQLANCCQACKLR